MRSMRPDKDISVSTIRIPTASGSIPALVLSPKAVAQNAAFQMPLYPMLDDRDTESSRDNHGKVWNTWKNHLAWKLYLHGIPKAQVPAYAAPARAQDFADLPPAYTFVGDGEPFYAETLHYIENLKRAGIPAEVNVYHTDIHAFDMMRPELEISGIAAEKFNQVFAYAKEHYFAENP